MIVHLDGIAMRHEFYSTKMIRLERTKSLPAMIIRRMFMSSCTCLTVLAILGRLQSTVFTLANNTGKVWTTRAKKLDPIWLNHTRSGRLAR